MSRTIFAWHAPTDAAALQLQSAIWIFAKLEQAPTLTKRTALIVYLSISCQRIVGAKEIKNPAGDRSHALLTKWLSIFGELTQGTTRQKPVHPHYVAKLVDQLATSDSVFPCGAGTPTIRRRGI